MRKLAFLLVVIALLAGCTDNLKEPAKYRAGDFVESVVSGQRGQIICNTCNTCDTPDGKVTEYRVRFPVGAGFSLSVQNTKGDGKPRALATEHMCEFELRPAKE